MYNLFVTFSEDAWEGEPQIYDLGRCLREYTDNDLKAKYASLTDDLIEELKRFPSIFAYEAHNEKDPKFGLITDVRQRGTKVRIEYEIIPLDRFLSHTDFDSMSFELDVTGWEMNRTHWALKNVELEKELSAKGFHLPRWVQQNKKAVDITKHDFDVSFSFPGEIRGYVESIAIEVEKRLGPNSYFYDNNYKAQLARPSLDLLLQSIYRERSKLVVVFLCEKYQEKEWCGLEFRAISEIIKKKDYGKVMFIKMDEGRVEGVFETDGYIDGNSHSPSEVAEFIKERIEINL